MVAISCVLKVERLKHFLRPPRGLDLSLLDAGIALHLVAIERHMAQGNPPDCLAEARDLIKQHFVGTEVIETMPTQYA